MKPAHTLVPLILLGTYLFTAGCEDSSGGGGGVPDAGGPNINLDSGSGAVDAGSTDSGDSGVSCPKPTSGPTEHQGTIATETWTADKSPHLIKSDMTVNGTLTLEPCAEVLLGGVKSLSMNATGKLVAQGKAGQPIHIGAIDPQKPFAQLRASGGGTMRLSYVNIDGGGDPQNTILDVIGTIQLQGADQTLPTQETIFVDHVSVSGSKSNGLYLQDGAGFAAGSNELTVTGSVNFPLGLSARAVATVPSGKYTGNAIDEIDLPGGGGYSAVQEDSTMHERGVPYRIGNSLSQGYLVVEKQTAGGLATLTIEPGVTLRFKKGGELIVETFSGTEPARGALIAAGTQAKPIIFTSASKTPAPGDWIGISFGETPAAVDKIDNAHVEYAGGLTSSGSSTCNTDPIIPDAAIKVLGLPAGEFVTNTTISNSAAHGIDRGWRNDAKPDFLPTNTFVAIAACNQTYPKDSNGGGCPMPVPCPKTL